MLISQAIAELQLILEASGDLPIAGGYLADDTPLRKIRTLDRHCCSTDLADEAVEVYLEM